MEGNQNCNKFQKRRMRRSRHKGLVENLKGEYAQHRKGTRAVEAMTALYREGPGTAGEQGDT